jgi:hypothetical protein
MINELQKNNTMLQMEVVQLVTFIKVRIKEIITKQIPKIIMNETHLRNRQMILTL